MPHDNFPDPTKYSTYFSGLAKKNTAPDTAAPALTVRPGPPAQQKTVLLNLGTDLLARVDEFRFHKRFPNRQEAARFLLSYALDQLAE